MSAVYLDQLIHQSRATVGLSPRPAGPLDPELVRTPVRVALYRPGASQPFGTVEAAGLAVHPYLPERRDEATGRVTQAEQPAEVVLAVVIPDPAAG